MIHTSKRFKLMREVAVASFVQSRAVHQHSDICVLKQGMCAQEMKSWQVQESVCTHPDVQLPPPPKPPPLQGQEPMKSSSTEVRNSQEIAWIGRSHSGLLVRLLLHTLQCRKLATRPHQQATQNCRIQNWLVTSRQLSHVTTRAGTTPRPRSLTTRGSVRTSRMLTPAQKTSPDQHIPAVQLRHQRLHAQEPVHRDTPNEHTCPLSSTRRRGDVALRC